MKRATGLGEPRDLGAAKTMTMAVWLVILAVLVLAGVDGFKMIVNRAHTENDAQAAALAASQAYQQDNKSLNSAYAAAVASVAGKNETVLTTGFTVDANYTVHLVVQRTVKTIACSHLGFCKHLAVATEHGDASFTPSG